MTLTERYDEITALLPDIDLDEYVHGGRIEDYITMAAELLGFENPSLALSLDIDLKTLMEFYAR